MLKNLFAALDSALGAARSALVSHATLVRQGLATLDEVAPAFGARAAAYVLDGSEAAVVNELAPHADKAGALLGGPGRLYWDFGMGYVNERNARRVQAALDARDALYRAVKGEPAELEMLVRLGHVLEAADRGHSLQRAGSAAPDWLQYVLNDALWASQKSENAKREGDTLRLRRPAWDIRLVRGLLDAAGLPQPMALSIVFERRDIDAWFAEQAYRRLLLPGPLDEDMLARPDEVMQLARALSAAGRVLLANRIGTSDALRGPFAALLVRLAVGDGKTVRAAAARHLDALGDARLAHLDALLRGGAGDERANAAELLARIQGAGAQPALAAALAQETSKPVQQAIRGALSRIEAAQEATDAALPEPPPLPEWVETTLADDALDLLLANLAQLLERAKAAAAKESERNRTAKHPTHWEREAVGHFSRLDAGTLYAALRALNGEQASMRVLESAPVIQVLSYQGRLEARPDFGLLQALRMDLGFRPRSSDWLWHGTHLQAWRRRQDPSQVDLRRLGEAAARCGAPADVFARTCLRASWAGGQPQFVMPPERVWPYLAGFPALIDEGLGMVHGDAPRYQGPDLGMTLAALDTFPVVPARWLPRVMEFALGETKSQRQAAQRILSRLPDIGKRVVDALGAGKQELRSEAARWLARMDYRPAVPALYAALDKETRETVSAELLTALEKLGEDIAPRLAPDVLLKQAHKGLKAKLPAGLAWLPFDALPACAWRDGTPVDPAIIRWWVVLAAKLKEPAGNGLLLRYLGLLDPAGRAALGRFLLHQFIGRDTAHPTLEEGIAWANQHAAQRYQEYQRSAQQWPQYYAELGKLTPDQVFERVKREKMGEYLGSAIGEKGLLALVSGMPGHELVDAIRLYMRDHYPRRAQVEALLEAAAASDDPAVIQFVLGTARRYRTASVQEKARLLVQRIAERNGWTQDQLADRTVPTGGLDETGRMTFAYGAREFSVTLDDKLKPVLHNPDGKPIAALPAARQNDPPESVKEGKAAFGACRKEVKQVVDQQTARLYEAMCAGRAWPLADWNEYLRRHPVVGRLAQRLAWTRLAEDGAVLGVFRPTEDGSLIDADDEEVELPPDARVGLAHAALLDEPTAHAWLAHFRDYKVTPLFAQFTRRAPDVPDPLQEAIADRQGWTTDTFTLRGAFSKLGYQRAGAEDGGFFMEYTKEFASAGIQVRIEFSGNTLPEENVPAALKTLGFVRLGQDTGRARGNVPLGKVPRVLLAEACGDYHAVAASCAGFDPDWEGKMPW